MKKPTLALLTAVLAGMVAEWPRIRYEMKTVRRIWQIVIIALVSTILALSLLSGLDLLPEFLGIFGLKMPL